MVIARRLVGAGQPCVVIAEAGVNHNGDIGMAMELVDAAAEAKADVVKFQTFHADTLTTISAPAASYQRDRIGASNQRSMLAELELPLAAFERLMVRCEQRGIEFMSTPFDEESASALVAAGMNAIKIPSGELTNPRLLRHVASLGRAIILSTGMSTMSEIEAALEIISDARRGGEVALLHCVSCYPAEPHESNLRAMDTMSRAFGVPVGLSDHSLGLAVPIAAVALGATIIEKHLTLDRSLPGPDHAASIEPSEFRELVRSIRDVEAALGDGRKQPVAREMETAAVARRSLAAARDIGAGESIFAHDMLLKRPGVGLAGTFESRVVGRKARVAIPRDTLITLDMLE